MDKVKDYDAIAKAGWKSLLEFGWKASGEEAKLASFSKGIPQLEQVMALQRRKDDLFGGHYSSVDLGAIEKILVGASDDLIKRVAEILKPIDIEQRWFKGLSFAFYEWTRQQRKELNYLIKMHGAHLAWIHERILNQRGSLFGALGGATVEAELRTSATALKDAVELARAYIRLFDALPTRWNRNGKDYSQITSHPYWTDIIRSTMALVDEALSDRSNYRIGSRSKYPILADLLHLAYPWAWVANKANLKLLRGRV